MKRTKLLSNLSDVQIRILVDLYTNAQPHMTTLTRRFLVNSGCILEGVHGYTLTVKGEQYAKIAVDKDAQP